MYHIGIAAYSGVPSPTLSSKARILVREILSRVRNVVFIVGAYMGLMRIVVDEVLRLNGRVMLVIPRDYEGYEYPDGCIIVRTGLDIRGRSIILVRSSDILVGLGGGLGTLIEVLVALAEGKPVFLLLGEGLPTDKILKAYPDGVVDRRVMNRIVYSDDPRALAKLIVETIRSLKS